MYGWMDGWMDGWMPVVLYGCENWVLTLREERRLRVLRRIFGPRRDEVTGEWRGAHNEELNDLYCSHNIVRVIKSRGMRCWACGAYGGEERRIQGFGGETGGKEIIWETKA